MHLDPGVGSRSPSRKGIAARQEPGLHRCVLESRLARLCRYRLLSVQYARRADIHQASPTVGCTLIRFNHLQKGS